MQYIKELQTVTDIKLEGDVALSEKLLLELLLKIVRDNLTEPLEMGDAYRIVEMMFFYWNRDFEPKNLIVVDPDFNNRFPLNSYLLNGFSLPDEINLILFQLLCHLYPGDPSDLSAQEISNAIENILTGKPSGLPAHIFKYTFSEKFKGKVKVDVYKKKIITHIMSF